jgi:hypothetical protein
MAVVAAAVVAASGGLAYVGRASAAPVVPPAAPGRSEADASTVDPAARDRVLPQGWRASGDVAWTTSGDSTGLHLLVAKASTGYSWRTAVTLSEPGFDTDRWVGNACITGSGRRAVVAYAPRNFTNRPQLFDRGAFSAVVDLVTGSVRKLGVGTTLAYFNPGCGAGEAVVLTQAGQDLGRTRLLWLDAATGAVKVRADVPGQATSAVPVGDQIVAADGNGLTRIGPSGRRSAFAATKSLPFHVHPDAGGGVVFLQKDAETAVVRRATSGRVTDLARGPLGQVGVRAGAGGRVFLTGKANPVAELPAGVSRLDVAARADVSSLGQLAVVHVAARAGEAIPAELAVDPRGSRPVRLDATVPTTRQSVRFRLTPAARGGAAPPAAVSGARVPAGAGTLAAADDPIDSDRTCAVARNDSQTKAYQPHWNQVEWAADLAVVDSLRVSRPTNWKGTGLPAWTPQGMFPSIALDGGGTVPPQILLGVLTQESNLWQASRHTVEGLTGNPLIGNFYGQAWGGANPWAINWANADCGYGIGQVTDGMRLTHTSMTPTQKRAIALDYATNIAASLRILQQKWNQTRRAGIIINDGDPRWPENWWAAVWAYNTGMNPSEKTGNTTGCTPSPSCTDGAGNWGLGYTNNLANASYPRDREAFLETDPDDARNPQWWSYPEKVLGWAAYPIIKTELNNPDEWHAGFTQTWWLSNIDRHDALLPPLDLFCDASVHCDINRPGEGCTRSDFHCWWHKPVTWKTDCDQRCGRTSSRYQPGSAEPAGRESTNYPPECGLSPLPSNAIIVDDVPTAPVRGCSRPNLSGSFGFQFAQDSTGKYRSKIDLHQIGAGWGDHFWFGHTWNHTQNVHEVKGIWTPTLPGTGWYRVLAHLPDHGAHTRTARYEVKLADGSTRSRVVNQFNQNKRNTWAHVGSFRLGAGSTVTLSNLYNKGDGNWDVAYDAVAFIPLPSKPYTYVAFGDSYSAGEGNGPYDRDSDFEWKSQEDRCHRAQQGAYAKQITHNGANISSRSNGAEPYEFHFLACSGATTVSMTDAAIDAAGENVGETTPWRSEDWHFGEEQQLERGFLDADTDLVTLTIGGNDMSFAAVIEGCMLRNPIHDCLSDDFYLTRNGRVDPQPLHRYQPHVISLTASKLRKTYEEILRRAPNARVVVLGYPALWPTAAERTGNCAANYLALSHADLDWFNEMAVLFGNTIADTVLQLRNAGKNIRYLSVNNVFHTHRLCEYTGGANTWLYDWDYTDPFDPGSLHPNPAGQAGYATVAQQGKEMA